MSRIRWTWPRPVSRLTADGAADAALLDLEPPWDADADDFDEAPPDPDREDEAGSSPPPTPRDPMNAKAPATESTEAAGLDAVRALAPRGFAYRLPVALRVVHALIIVNLAAQVLYGSFQVFWVLQPPGVVGPMFGAAVHVPFELMMARRMYALESWVAFLGLALYIGVTEVLPRRWP